MQHLDFWLFSQINNLAGRMKLLDTTMIIITKYGALLYGLILIYLFFKGKDLRSKTANRKLAIKAVLSALIALAINQVIGLFYFRPRPFANHSVNLLIDKSPDPSFPSDHSTGSSSLTFAVLRENRILGTLMFILMLLITISRIYVGTHYPFDILGGMFTGFLGSYIVNKLWSYVDSKVSVLLDIVDLVLNKFIKKESEVAK